MAPMLHIGTGHRPSVRGHSTYRRGLPRRRVQTHLTGRAMDRCAKGEGGVWVNPMLHIGNIGSDRGAETLIRRAHEFAVRDNDSLKTDKLIII